MSEGFIERKCLNMMMMVILIPCRQQMVQISVKSGRRIIGESFATGFGSAAPAPAVDQSRSFGFKCQARRESLWQTFHLSDPEDDLQLSFCGQDVYERQRNVSA